MMIMIIIMIMIMMMSFCVVSRRVDFFFFLQLYSEGQKKKVCFAASNESNVGCLCASPDRLPQQRFHRGVACSTPGWLAPCVALSRLVLLCASCCRTATSVRD